VEKTSAGLTAFAMAASILCAGVARAQPQAAVQDLGNGIHAAIGVAVGTGGGAEARRVAVPQSNTFLVVTPDGNVVIDTSGPAGGAVHQPLLAKVSAAPLKAIILTHGHGDHTGGRGSLVPAWCRDHRAAGVS
jgi:glyoxylase-like metal-dependent hydrolase (beta-lactamase superfamily II)